MKGAAGSEQIKICIGVWKDIKMKGGARTDLIELGTNIQMKKWKALHEGI